MNYTDDEEYKAPFSMSVWRKLFPYIARYKKKLIIVIIFMTFCALCDISYPLFLRHAINNFIVAGNYDGLALFSVLLGSVFLLQAFAVFMFIRYAVNIESNFGKDLRRDVFYHLQKLPFSYYNKTPVGYMMARTMSDTGLIGDKIAWSTVDLMWAGIYIVGVMVSMLFLNWKLALIVIVAMPIIAVVTFFFQIKILRINRQARRINSKMTAAMNEGIVGAATSKTLVIEEQNFNDFNGITSSLRAKNIHAARYRAIFFPLLFFLGSIATAFIIRSGSMDVLNGTLMIGTFSAFVNYSLDIFMPMQQVAYTLTEFVSAQANVERVTTLLEVKPEIVDSPEVMLKYGDNFNPKRENWEQIAGDIEFENITFRYPDSDINIFENFSLKIKAGACIAIVGETGAGKSTMVNLVCRFFEPNEGRILVDGKDVRERSQLWLHSNLGYVLQNPHLFSGTVKDNIRYGRLDANDEEICEAAKLVSAHEIIMKLEKGYETDVGEGGSKLSTGQKQLISLARAVLADPRIFILDEATSSIDTETEQLVQNAISVALENRTSFLIAHRLSTIRKADLILVVHDGKIVEQGTHAELMKMRTRYYNLYTRQFEEEIKV